MALACTECRARHLKCDAGVPSCNRCETDGRNCSYIKSRRGWKGTRRKKAAAAAAAKEETKSGSDEGSPPVEEKKQENANEGKVPLLWFYHYLHTSPIISLFHLFPFYFIFASF